MICTYVRCACADTLLCTACFSIRQWTSSRSTKSACTSNVGTCDTWSACLHSCAQQGQTEASAPGNTKQKMLEASRSVYGNSESSSWLSTRMLCWSRQPPASAAALSRCLMPRLKRGALQQGVQHLNLLIWQRPCQATTIWYMSELFERCDSTTAGRPIGMVRLQRSSDTTLCTCEVRLIMCSNFCRDQMLHLWLPVSPRKKARMWRSIGGRPCSGLAANSAPMWIVGSSRSCGRAMHVSMSEKEKLCPAACQ